MLWCIFFFGKGQKSFQSGSANLFLSIASNRMEELRFPSAVVNDEAGVWFLLLVYKWKVISPSLYIYIHTVSGISIGDWSFSLAKSKCYKNLTNCRAIGVKMQWVRANKDSSHSLAPINLNGHRNKDLLISPAEFLIFTFPSVSLPLSRSLFHSGLGKE